MVMKMVMKMGAGTFRKLRRFASRDDGGTLAELAIMVPFLAIMLAGVCEYGRYFQTYTTLVKATRSSTRYLSNHPYSDSNTQNSARNLAVCGKVTCNGGDELVTGLTGANICIESAGVGPETVTVSIPRTAGGCGSPFIYQPIFDLGALLNSPTFTLQLPISPSTTMRYLLN